MSLDFVPVTTPAKTKRHWSLVPTPRWPRHIPLCNTTPYAMSQAELDDAMPTRWHKRTVIADLPPCKSCDHSRQLRTDADWLAHDDAMRRVADWAGTDG